MTDNVCKSNGGDTSNEQIRGDEKIVADCVNFSIVPDMSWTPERIKAIEEIANRKIVEFANEFPTALTEGQVARFTAIIEREAEPHKRRNPALTPALIEKIAEIFAKSLEDYKYEDLPEQCDELAKALPKLTSECAKRCAEEYVESCEGKKRKGEMQLPTLTCELLGEIESTTHKGYETEFWRDGSEDGIAASSSEREKTRKAFNEAIEFARKRVWTYACDEHQTWTDGLLKYLLEIGCAGVDSVGKNNVWTDASLKKAKDVVGQKLDDYKKTHSETLTEKLFEDIKATAYNSLECFAYEHWFDLKSNKLLADKYRSLLIFCVGVPVGGARRLPLWPNKKRFDNEDIFALLRRWNATLKAQCNTAWNAKETPEATADFLREKGWETDCRKLSVDQVAECGANGFGFTDGGRLGGNLYYDQAFVQTCDSCRVRKETNEAFTAAFDAYYAPTIKTNVKQWLSSKGFDFKDFDDSNSKNVVDADLGWRSNAITTLLGGKANVYKGLSGLAPFAASFCITDYKGWLEKQEKQKKVVCESRLKKDEEGAVLDTFPSEEKLDLAASDRRISPQWEKLLKATAEKIGAVYKNIAKEDKVKTRVFRLRIIEKWTNVNVANTCKIGETQANSGYQNVRKNTINAILQAYEEINGSTWLARVRETMLETSPRSLRDFGGVLDELQKVAELAQDDIKQALIEVAAWRTRLNLTPPEDMWNALQEVYDAVQGNPWWGALWGSLKKEKYRRAIEKAALWLGARNLERIKTCSENLRDERQRWLQEEKNKLAQLQKARPSDKAAVTTAQAAIASYARKIDAEKATLAYIKEALGKLEKAFKAKAPSVQDVVGKIIRDAVLTPMWKEVIGPMYQTRIGELRDNTSALADEVDAVVATWIERVKSIDPQTGDYNP